MCPVLCEVRSCLKFVKLYEDKGEDDDGDADLIKLIINFTNQMGEIPKVPLLAVGIMQICEVFGSCVPNVSWTVKTGGKLSAHEVFSNAFTLLLRFWRFDHLPIEQVRTNAATPPLGSLFSPENLLLVRNGKVASFGRSAKDNLKLKRLSKNVCFFECLCLWGEFGYRFMVPPQCSPEPEYEEEYHPTLSWLGSPPKKMQQDSPPPPSLLSFEPFFGQYNDEVVKFLLEEENEAQV